VSSDVWAPDDELARPARRWLPASRPVRYSLLAAVGLVAVLVLVVVAFVALYVRPGSHGVVAQGANMLPTIERGDHLLTVPDRHPKTGDVVVYRRDDGEGAREFLARVAATGGQTISCPPDAGEESCSGILVDGKPLDERSYLNLEAAPSQMAFAPITIPAGSIFLLGDNRNDSGDSRVHGTTPESAVVGKVRLRYRPLSRFGSVH
jgi:signal peptidase I